MLKKLLAFVLSAAICVAPVSAQMLTLNYGPGAFSGPDLTNTDSACSSVSGTVTTFTSKNLGGAGPNKINIVSISWVDGTSAGTAEISGVTIGGTAATRAVRSIATDNTNSNAEVWYASVAGGGTGNIVVTTGTAVNQMTIAVYRLINYSVSTPFLTATGTTTAGISTNTGDALIAVGTRSDSAATTLTNMVQDYGFSCGATQYGTHYSFFPNTPSAINTAISPSTNTPLIAMVTWHSGAVCADPSWSSVKLLMPMEGANLSTTGQGLTDRSSAAHGVATSGASSTIETAQFQFGTSSYRMHAAIGNSLVYNDSADWRLSAANSDQFTIEGWVRYAGTGTGRSVLSQFPGAGNNSWQIWNNSSASEWDFTFSTDGTATTTISTSGAALTTNTWYAWAVDKDATGKIRIYKNGVMLGSSTPANSSFFDSTVGLGILSINSVGNRLDGWGDEFRITKGVARYASDSGYTVSTTSFPICN